MKSDIDVGELRELIYNVMREELCINVEGIKLTDELAKLNVDTDDWSFIFIPAIEEKFGVKPSLEEWEQVGTIEEIIQLLSNYLKIRY
jgi:acyl carrier protein